MTSAAKECAICCRSESGVSVVSCLMCYRDVHAGPLLYCAAINYELADGRAYLGASITPHTNTQHVTFPAWPVELIDTDVETLVVCLDCLLSDM